MAFSHNSKMDLLVPDHEMDSYGRYFVACDFPVMLSRKTCVVKLNIVNVRSGPIWHGA